MPAGGMKYGCRSRRGMLTAEAITALVLVGVVMGLLASVVSRFNDHYDALVQRGAAFHAAESAWERLRAGRGYTQATFEADYPGMKMSESRRAADGAWAGFDEVAIEVTAKSRRGLPICARVPGYVSASGGRP